MLSQLFRGVVEAVFRQRAVFLVIAIGALTLAGTASVFLRPVWRAAAVVEMAKGTGGPGGMDLLADHELHRQVVARIGAKDLYPGLSADAAARAIGKDLAASEQEGGSYRVSYDGRTPALALRTIETTFQVFEERHARALAHLAGAAFDQQAATFQGMLDEARQRLDAYQQNNKARSADDERRILLRQRLDVTKDVKQISNSEDELMAQMQALKGQMDNTSATIQPEDQSGRYKMVDDAKARLLELQLKERELLAKYQESSQFVVTVREEISRVRAFLNEMSASISARNKPAVNELYVELSKNLVKAQTQMTALEARRRAAEAKLADIDRRLDEVNATDQELRALQQAVADGESNVKRIEEVRRQTIEASQNNGLIYIAKPAVLPEPVQPNPALYFGLALPLGLLGGVGMALLAQTFSATFGAPREVERRLGLPVLADLPTEN